MQTISDISYGVIPLIQKDGIWKVFLINQIGRRGDVYWTFPKGHPEKGETPEESARRELHEETGIALKSLDVKNPYTQTYSFRHEETMVHKTVVYYVGEAQGELFTIQEDEVKEAKWLSCEEALDCLSYEPAKIMFRQVMDDKGCE